MQIATEAIDRITTTAESHDRVMVVEVMGRTQGWIATHAGMAAGADAILVPEEPYDLEDVAAVVRGRADRGHRYSVVVVAEGVRRRTTRASSRLATPSGSSGSAASRRSSPRGSKS